MKLFSAAQIRQWDQYTIQNEPVASVDLMERAATQCCNWISLKFPDQRKYMVFCGPGNNGGDGLAIARMLLLNRQTVQIFILGNTEITVEKSALPVITSSDIIIDALFGYGLNRPLQAWRISDCPSIRSTCSHYCMGLCR